MIETEAFAGFAGPCAPFDSGLYELINATFAESVVERFLNSYAGELTAASEGVAALLAAWPDARVDPKHAWDPSVGCLYRTLQEQSSLQERLEAASTLALHFIHCGTPCCCSMVFSEPARLRFGGWLLPLATRVAVEAHQNRLRIETRREGERRQSFDFERCDSIWSCDRSSPLPCFGPDDAPILLLPAEAVNPREFLDQAPFFYSRLTPIDVECCQVALDFLEASVPAYGAWITRVLRQVVPLRPTDGLMRSGSKAHHLGLIHITLVPNALGVGEMLVHECTHQYYHVLERVSPLHDGSDTTLYYSPVKQRGRPLDKILLAYHAFANVLIYYASLLDVGSLQPEACRRSITDLLPVVTELEAPLRSTSALTAAGRALCEPLMAAVAGVRRA